MIKLDTYMQKYNKINTKEKGLQPFLFNKQQKELYRLIKNDYNNNKPCRLIVLKGRQFGVSTFTDCYIASRVMTKKDVNGFIVAHNSLSTNNLYDICKTVYNNLPEALKPMKKYDNDYRLVFDNPNKESTQSGLNSSIKAMTAGSDDIGRSLTINYLHMSEFAFWKNQKDQYLGLIQTVPYVKNSLVVIESTANGYDEFKLMWDKAVAKENDFTPVFFSWLDFEEYQKEYDGFTLTKEEIELKRKTNCTLEQISWRRYAIETLANGDVDKFNQEYPTTPEDAFISSGRPYFNTNLINEYISKCWTGIKGYISGNQIMQDASSDITFYDKVEKGVPYVIGADTAGEGSDNATAYVINNITGKIVCRYKTLDEEGIYTQELNKLGKYYNDALISVETNFSTYPVKTLAEVYDYPNLYVRERIDTYTNQTVKSFGFNTNRKSRPLILGILRDELNTNIKNMLDKDILNEMMVFHKDEKGKPKALEGYHDDCVMALAIAYGTREQQRRSKKIEVQHKNEYQTFLNFGG
ncbi:MAG: hypothetical protein GX675_01310 [Erysipelotrichaceae bacterium]|nr:hypothetical protein [Erysipelotrichaceae bacterium]